MSRHRNPVLKWLTQNHVRKLKGGHNYLWLGLSLNLHLPESVLIVAHLDVCCKGKWLANPLGGLIPLMGSLGEGITPKGYNLLSWRIKHPSREPEFPCSHNLHQCSAQLGESIFLRNRGSNP